VDGRWLEGSGLRTNYSVMRDNRININIIKEHKLEITMIAMLSCKR